MISQETSKRISKEAKTFAESEATALAKMGLPRDQAQTACAGYYDGYIAGAEAEATRAAPLILLLGILLADRNLSIPGGLMSNESVKQLREALNNYNKTDK